MDIKRYLTVQAVKTKNNELIPIWDERIIFEKTEMFGNVITLKDDFRSNHYSVVECIFDLKTKKLEVGIELDYYPSENDLEFKKGEVVLYEKSTRRLSEAKITEVVYEEYEMTIKRGRKLDYYWISRFKEVQFDGDTLYAMKQWKPFYVLDNGTKIEWSHQLFHKV
jgi:hypothetical protein